ncbi:hypothetical protein C0N28_14910 [Salmonella enterica]|nr:hypothetical protein [Salmonella enterica]
MRKTWFRHPNCTTEEADELVKQYRRRGVKTERSLNYDCIHWTVSAFLPTSSKPARPDNRWRNRVWG